ncbi:MAG TPA: copper chaperone PCu(A)C [Gemmatimonadaceae bacterium]|nr:copper chaperone PCu(A)C [Gemmatimonadaceae bacterium]
MRPARAAAGAMLALTVAACGGAERPADASVPHASSEPAGDSASDAVYRAGGIVVSGVVAPRPAGEAPAAVYLTITNESGSADTLVAVASGAGEASLHTQQRDAGTGTTRMAALSEIVVPAHEVRRLAPGGDHVMITGLGAPLAVGDTLPLVLTFRRAGQLSIAARVRTYAELEQALDTTAHAGH